MREKIQFWHVAFPQNRTTQEKSRDKKNSYNYCVIEIDAFLSDKFKRLLFFAEMKKDIWLHSQILQASELSAAEMSCLEIW